MGSYGVCHSKWGVQIFTPIHFNVPFSSCFTKVRMFITMLRFIHFWENVKWYACFTVILVYKNKKKSIYIRYDLLVNSFKNSLSMSFHSSRFFSVKSTLSHTFRTSDLVHYDLQDYIRYSKEHSIPNIRSNHFDIPAFLLRSLVHRCLRTTVLNL
jgi:hypothetical protein